RRGLCGLGAGFEGLEHRALGPRPEVRVVPTRHRPVRPGDEAGVAVESQQLAVATEAEAPAADDPEPAQGPRRPVVAGAPGRLAGGGERVGPALAGGRGA